MAAVSSLLRSDHFAVLVSMRIIKLAYAAFDDKARPRGGVATCCLH